MRELSHLGVSRVAAGGTIYGGPCSVGCSVWSTQVVLEMWESEQGLLAGSQA